MQHPFGALTRNFILIRLRKFRGQRPAGPAGDGETRLVSAKCSMTLNGHLLNPVGIRPTQPWASCNSASGRARHLKVIVLSILQTGMK